MNKFMIDGLLYFPRFMRFLFIFNIDFQVELSLFYSCIDVVIYNVFSNSYFELSDAKSLYLAFMDFL